MLRSKMIRAAIPKGVPINFVDSVIATGSLSTSGNITVSTDDFVIAFKSGQFASFLSNDTYGGTSSISSITDDITSSNGTAGAQTAYYLDLLSHFTVTSGGTLNITDNDGGQNAGFGLLAVDGGDSLSFNQGTSSISVSSVTANDIVVIFEIAEDVSSGVIPSTPSGYTSAGTYNIVAGKGGGSTYIGARVSYKTGQSGTVSHTVTTAGGIFNTGVIIRIYNA